jgi:hypothetical protein
LVASTDLGVAAFQLDDTRKTVRLVLRYEFGIGELAIPVIGGGSHQSFLNLPPAAFEGPERINPRARHPHLKIVPWPVCNCRKRLPPMQPPWH